MKDKIKLIQEHEEFQTLMAGYADYCLHQRAFLKQAMSVKDKKE